MVRATTPTFELTFEDIDLTEAAEVLVTIKQGDVELTKSGDDLTVTATTISVFLSQGETLLFTSGRKAEIQANFVYLDNTRACSNIASVAVDRNLLAEVVNVNE